MRVHLPPQHQWDGPSLHPVVASTCNESAVPFQMLVAKHVPVPGRTRMCVRMVAADQTKSSSRAGQRMCVCVCVWEVGGASRARTWGSCRAGRTRVDAAKQTKSNPTPLHLTPCSCEHSRLVSVWLQFVADLERAAAGCRVQASVR